MANSAKIDSEIPEKPLKGKKTVPILIGLSGAVIAGSVTFYLLYSGLVGGTTKSSSTKIEQADFAFVAMDQLTISLAPGANAQFLRFSAQLEVAAGSVAEVDRLRPRLADMFNLYLRAVEPADLADPTAMLRLRAQLLRRAQLIAGDGHIRDVLITEFILS